MKTTLKFSTLLVALASVFTFSSCLNSNEDSTYPAYASYVTITGDQFMGYTFYSDFGCVLRPTSASVQEVLPGLGNSNVKRAYVSFDLASATENGQNLEVGKIYDIILRQSYYANYAIPTYNTIEHTAASDSLITNNKRVQDVNKDIWASNGYLNALITINYQQNKTFSMNTFYNREKDIDPETNTMYLNLFYDSKSQNPTAQGQSVFSFDLPEHVVGQFSSDTINVVLKAIADFDETTLVEVGNCRVAKKDFYTPMY